MFGGKRTHADDAEHRYNKNDDNNIPRYQISHGFGIASWRGVTRLGVLHRVSGRSICATQPLHRGYQSGGVSFFSNRFLDAVNPPDRNTI